MALINEEQLREKAEKKQLMRQPIKQPVIKVQAKEDKKGKLKKKEKGTKKDKEEKKDVSVKINYREVKKTADFLPFSTLEENQVISMRGVIDKYMTMIQIDTDDNFIKNDTDLLHYVLNQTLFYQNVFESISIFGLNYPTITRLQQDDILYKLETEEHPKKIQALNNELGVLRWIEETKTDKEFFTMMFSDTKEGLEKVRQNVERILGGLPGYTRLDDEKIIAVLNKMNNLEKKILL
ncbi:hypothetical protein [Listeria booriae]|uniref:hypothetical protein n=1 Tax=Listeria booriae TaxID=1552123 RepID=UPI0016293D75|nr:hypothetical protein [Listeria booriae]MBC2305836.1 hypothetical protein [Listeria booriae]